MLHKKAFDSYGCMTVGAPIVSKVTQPEGMSDWNGPAFLLKVVRSRRVERSAAALEKESV